MAVGLYIPVFHSKSEIDDTDAVVVAANTHDNITWLDVAVNEMARVDVLQARDLGFLAL